MARKGQRTQRRNGKQQRQTRKRNNRNNVKRGGSLASDRVMEAVNVQAPGMDGYQNQMHLPAQETLTAGFKTQTHELTGGAAKHMKQMGGRKGDMKKNLVTLIKVARANPEMKPETLIKNFHAARPMARRVSEKELKEGQPAGNQTGGNGFLSLAGCGPANVPDAGRKYAHHFTKTSKCPSPEEIANPPMLGSAGSGLDDLGVGAPAL
jgi:hypothetical protein